MIRLQHHAYSFWIYIVWVRVMVTYIWFDWLHGFDAEFIGV